MARLRELAPGYRAAAEALRLRIQLVEELPVRDEVQRMAKTERLRLLEAMRRDARDGAVVCERYYDRGYRCNERIVM